MIKALLPLLTEQLSRASGANAENELYWLMMHCLDTSRVSIMTNQSIDRQEDAWDNLACIFKRYHEGVPIAYLIGHTPFLDLDIYVSEGVLIPRADTEAMVLALIKQMKQNDAVLELGVGSGAIACTLAKHCPSITVLGVDKSPQAVAQSIKNAKHVNVVEQVTFLQGDWNEISHFGTFNLVVSNPPYIDNQDTEVSPQVREFEPHDALFSDNQGLADLKRIIEIAKHNLVEGGILALEHGYLQQTWVANMLKEQGFDQVVLGKSYNKPRYILAKRGL